ncbi:NAD(P)-binding protein [Naematelia encephala]|uniref:NAD(P)-binding protein n=1 Tax=Naematelia encephala TaxID=71784 RepID=A0A1Y2AV31_9TREE|nr:NAD(P)-binding protein [Naematelia encephala]
MSVPTSTQAYILNEPPTGNITPSTFVVETRPIPELKDGQVLVRAVAFSNDPAQRGWMSANADPKRSYSTPVQKGEVMRAYLLGEVVLSKSEKHKVGSRVVGMLGWAEYAVAGEDQVRQAPPIEGQSEFIHLSFLGMTTLTAYVGAFGEMKLKPEHVIVISGAAGAVGSVLVQIAKKVIGCKKVVGIAGGKGKCDWVKSLGADECIDYKDPNYPTLLKDALPDYADRYFDNVGGEVLDNMLPLVKRWGHVAVCGAISSYMGGNPLKLEHWGEVISNRITIKGFLCFDHPDLSKTFPGEVSEWIKQGKITVSDGEQIEPASFKDIPEVWQILFKGGNKGKLITKLV